MNAHLFSYDIPVTILFILSLLLNVHLYRITIKYGKIDYAVRDRPGIVYAITDDSDAVRYVGKTTNVTRRMAEHKRRAYLPAPPLYKWLKDYLQDHAEVRYRVLETCQNKKELAVAEKEWIRHYTDAGQELLNLTKGG